MHFSRPHIFPEYFGSGMFSRVATNHSDTCKVDGDGRENVTTPMSVFIVVVCSSATAVRRRVYVCNTSERARGVLQESEFDEVVSLLNLLEIRSDTWQRAVYESSSSSPPLPPLVGQPPSAASSDLSARTDPENLSPASRFEVHPKKRRRRSSVPVNLSIDTKNDEDVSVTQSNWRVSKVSSWRDRVGSACALWCFYYRAGSRSHRSKVIQAPVKDDDSQIYNYTYYRRVRARAVITIIIITQSTPGLTKSILKQYFAEFAVQ